MSERIASKILRVTLFEDRAAVTRRARVRLARGVALVLLDGLAFMVDDSSLVAGVAEGSSPGARVLGSRVVRGVRQVSGASAEEIAAIERDVAAARARSGQAERGLSRARSEEARLVALAEAWSAGVRRTPRGDQVAEWVTAHDSLDGAFGRALDDVTACRDELELAKLDLERAMLRLAQGRAVTPRFEAGAEVQIETMQDGEVELEVSYRTPCALWRPEHLARLVRKPGKDEIVITTSATVWQRTGEDWKDVSCRFSTARPAQAASPPLLSDDVIAMQRRQEKTIQVEARDQDIKVAGVDGAARKVDEMPGVEDGGEPLWFEAVRAVTLPSDGQPFRVEIGERKVACEVDLVAYPELAEVAHLRATATLGGDPPLLAGPVRVARGGSMVGRGKTIFVGQGEPFELGFGVDDGVRVKRREEEWKETTPVIGTQHVHRTVRLFVSNVGAETRRVKVIDRIPVSEIDDVKIDVKDLGGGKLDAKDGFVTFDLEVTGNGTKELQLRYDVEAAAKVRMS